MPEKRRSHTTGVDGEDGSEVKRSKDNEGWLEISPQNLLAMGNLSSRPEAFIQHRRDFDEDFENNAPQFSNQTNLEKSSRPSRGYNGGAVEDQYDEGFSGFHPGLDYDYESWRNEYIFSDQEQKKSARTSQKNEPPDDDPESCCICMEVLDDQVHRGQPDSCEHIFCLCCIKAWSEKTNLCPLCKTEFNSILVDDGSVEEKVTSRKLRAEDFDEVDYDEDVDDDDEPLDDYEPDYDDLDEIGWPLSTGQTHSFDFQEDSDNSQSESRGFRKCPLCDLFVRYDEITICIVCLGAGHRACGYECGPGEESCNRCGMPLDDGTPIVHVSHLPHYLRHLDQSSLVGRLASAVEMVGNPRRIGWPSGNNGTTVPRSVRSMRTLTLRRQQNAQASRLRENVRETDPAAPVAPSDPRPSRPRRQRGRRLNHPRNTHDLSPTAGNAPRTVPQIAAAQPLEGTNRPRQNNRTTSTTRGTARGTARGNRGGPNARRSAEPSQQPPSGRGQSVSGRGQRPSGRGQRPSGRGQRGGQRILPTVEPNREEETTSTSAATNSDMGFRTRSVNTAAPRISSPQRPSRGIRSRE